MPTFYEGEPLLILEQQLDGSDYRRAYLLNEHNLSAFRRPAVKGGFCLTAAAVIASAIPWYAYNYGAPWVPVSAIVLMLVLSVFFFREQPLIIGNWADKVFRSNSMLSQPTKVIIYRDSIVCENDYEKDREYWTDFSHCFESRDYFILSGGIARELLVLKKELLSDMEKQQLSVHFVNTFAAKYRLVK